MAVCSWHQRQTPRTGGSPQLAVLVTSLLGCADGCRRWCSTSPLRRRIRILFLMLSMLSSPLWDPVPSVRRRAHPYDLVYVPEVAVRCQGRAKNRPSGRRSEHDGNPPHRNTHSIVEYMGRSHHPSPHPGGHSPRTGPHQPRRGVLVPVCRSHDTDTPALGILSPAVWASRDVGHVCNIHSLLLESASTSRATVPGHLHVHRRLGDLIWRRRLAVAE